MNACKAIPFDELHVSRFAWTGSDVGPALIDVVLSLENTMMHLSTGRAPPLLTCVPKDTPATPPRR